MKTSIFLTSIIVTCLFFSCETGQTFKQPKNLLCEYQVNPLGLDERQPRLSWQLSDTTRGAVQTAYQVLVASYPSLLKKDTGDIWNSEKVASDRSVWVYYTGAVLQSRTRYFWKVRTWDRDDQPSSWSETAVWEMGLLSPEEWKAKWTGMDIIEEDEVLTKYGSWITSPQPAFGKTEIFFRKIFEIPAGKTPRRAFINILGNTPVTFRLNGEPAGELDLTGNIS